jgi:hypothetical protein
MAHLFALRRKSVTPRLDFEGAGLDPHVKNILSLVAVKFRHDLYCSFPKRNSRVANPSARHRCLVQTQPKLAGGAESFLWFYRKGSGLDLTTATLSLEYPSFPKRNYLAKIIRAHSLRLLEIAPKPCYKKLHPKYPNNIFVPRQKGPERSCVFPPWRAASC